MSDQPEFPYQSFKGIAIFTPGGDLVYCIDPNKQHRWHLNLCSTLQQTLNLPEPPHFLVPCYTAAIDCWFDTQTQQMRMAAEAALPVLKYQALLNAVFGTGNLLWQPAAMQEELCDPAVLSTYRSQFPQLWENHDLVLQYGQTLPSFSSPSEPTAVLTTPPPLHSGVEGYVLRLFVSGHNAATEHILQNLHKLLEQLLTHPYTLKVIDVFQHPDQAEQDQISATPTLVRVWPRPVRRIVGSLESVDQLLRVLGSTEESLREE